MAVFSLVIIIMMFITSSDSSSLTIDCISANGYTNPPVAQRIFWSATEGATATGLLVAGGNDSLQALQGMVSLQHIIFVYVSIIVSNLRLC